MPWLSPAAAGTQASVRPAAAGGGRPHPPQAGSQAGGCAAAPSPPPSRAVGDAAAPPPAAGDDGSMELILAPPSRARAAAEATSAGRQQAPGSAAARAAGLLGLCRDARLARVPACPPPDRERLHEWSAVWPVSLRKRPVEPKVLAPSEEARMACCIKLALSHLGPEDAACPRSGAVLVDPSAGTMHAVVSPEPVCPAAGDCSSAPRQPLDHAAMRAIAELAAQGTLSPVAPPQLRGVPNPSIQICVARGGQRR